MSQPDVCSLHPIIEPHHMVHAGQNPGENLINNMFRSRLDTKTAKSRQKQITNLASDKEAGEGLQSTAPQTTDDDENTTKSSPSTLFNLFTFSNPELSRVSSANTHISQTYVQKIYIYIYNNIIIIDLCLILSSQK